MSVKDLLGKQGAPSFPFGRPGDKIGGKVASISATNQTYISDGKDHKAGDTVFWDNEKTNPKEMIVVTLQTDVNSAIEVDRAGVEKAVLSEDGKWTLFYSGHKFTSLQKAVRESGATDVLEGDHIETTFIEYSDRPPKERAFSPAKLYSTVHRSAPKGVTVVQAATTTPATTADVKPAVPYGPKPDAFPQAAWDVTPPAARALISPYVEPAKPLPGLHGPKPDYLPDAAWEVMTATQRNAMSPFVPANAPVEPVRPDAFPEAAWGVLDAAGKAAVVASFGPPV